MASHLGHGLSTDTVEDELQALEAIYGDDFVRLGGGHQRRGPQRQFCIRVVPVTGDEDNKVSVKLTFTLGTRYPADPPYTTLESDSLSSDQIDMLREVVDREVKSCAAAKQPGVFAAVSAAQEVLLTFNEGVATMSLRESMQARAASAAEAAAAHAAQAEAALAEQAKHAAEERARAAAEAAKRKSGVFMYLPLADGRPAPSSPAAGASTVPPGAGAGEGGKEEGDSELDGGGGDYFRHSGSLGFLLDGGSGGEPGASGAPLSRFSSDFVTLGDIGRGGFGVVKRARNRVDGMIYAVKVVPLGRSPRSNTRLLREVRTLSRLQHRHVVRYFNAWVEARPPGRGRVASGSGTGDYDEDGSYDCYSDEEEHAGTAAPPSPPGAVPKAVGASAPAGATAAAADDAASDWLGLETSHSAALHRRKRRPAPRSALQLQRRAGDSSTTSSSSSGSDGYSSDESSGSDESESESGSGSGVGGGSSYDSALAGLMGGGLRLEALMGGGAGAGARVGAGIPPAAARGVAAATGQGDSSSLFMSASGPVLAEEASATNTASGASGGAPPRPPPPRPLSLFIQMELCPATLRELVDAQWTAGGAGVPLPLPHRWRLVRQLLEALSFVHSQGILHRDLKPANVLLDGEGNVKLGDFGLAVAAGRPMRTARAFAPGASGNDPSSLSDMSAGVGTALYRSPEVSGTVGATSAVAYGPAADLYSFGVVLFELFMPAPFATLSERVAVIGRLRASGGTALPGDFAKAAPEGVLRLLPLLLASDPSSRPTAASLLSSPLVPSDRSVVDTSAFVADVLAQLSAPHSALGDQALGCLFSRPTAEWAEELFFSGGSGGGEGGAAVASSGPAYASAIRLLEAAFAKHHAVPFDPPALAPKPCAFAPSLRAAAHREIMRELIESAGFAPLQRLFGANAPAVLASGVASFPPLLAPLFEGGEQRKQRAQLLTRDGVVAELPWDHAHPFARWLGRQQHFTGVFRRFTVGKVYRAAQPPRELTEASFDIAWSADAPATVPPPEAEVLLTTVEVCRRFVETARLDAGEGGGQAFFVRLGHSGITGGLLEALGVPQKTFHALCEYFVSATACQGSQSPIAWSSLREQLCASLDLQLHVVDALRPLLTASPLDQLVGSLQSLRERLEGTIEKQLQLTFSTRPGPRDQLASFMSQLRGLLLFSSGLRQLLGIVGPLRSVSAAISVQLVLDLGFVEEGHTFALMGVLGDPSRVKAASGGAKARSSSTLGKPSQTSPLEAFRRLGESFRARCESDCIARGGDYSPVLLRNRLTFGATFPSRTRVAGVRFGVDKMARTIAVLVKGSASRLAHQPSFRESIQQPSIQSPPELASIEVHLLAAGYDAHSRRVVEKKAIVRLQPVLLGSFKSDILLVDQPLKVLRDIGTALLEGDQAFAMKCRGLQREAFQLALQLRSKKGRIVLYSLLTDTFDVVYP